MQIQRAGTPVKQVRFAPTNKVVPIRPYIQEDPFERLKVCQTVKTFEACVMAYKCSSNYNAENLARLLAYRVQDNTLNMDLQRAILIMAKFFGVA